MQLVKPESSSHWYSFENNVWSPCYQLPKKNGGGMKAVTLREARELGLLPSVTTFLQILDKPELDRWKQEKAIHAALTLPRKDGESEDDFAVRVVEDMEAESEKAIQFGQDIHGAIEDWIQGRPIPERLQPYLKSFVEWTQKEVDQFISSETIVGSAQWGYAGRLDLHCILKGIGEAVCDFKTSRLKVANGVKKPVFYNDWGLQLVAYAACVNIDCALVNVVIDSSEPGPIFCHQWTNKQQLWEMFKHCMELWKWQKDYNPAELAS